jgi:hypothetical protein
MNTYFGGCVAWTAARRFKRLAHFVHVAEAKVDYFERTIEVEEQIFRF